MLGLAALLGLDYAKYRGLDLLGKLKDQAIWFRWSIYIIAILSILIFGVWGSNYDANSFIYFQF